MRKGKEKVKMRRLFKESITAKTSEEFNTAANHHIIHVKYLDVWQ